MARAASTRKRASPGAAKRTSPAERLSKRLPLSHFPASTRFEAWGSWESLKSHAVRGSVTPEPGRHAGFKGLEDEHVFTFAGPCAYTRCGAVGDAAMFFHPAAEATAAGSASPFDTGALESGRLHPWHHETESGRWAFYLKATSPLNRWRADFKRWLEDSYTRPRRYLDTSGGRQSAGFPDKGDPHGLFAVNGPKDLSGADRRAWTWEVRIKDQLSLEKAEAILVPRRFAEDARRWKTTRGSGRAVRLFILPRGVPGDAEAVFRESERVCATLVGMR